jgi:hypothetical protein
MGLKSSSFVSKPCQIDFGSRYHSLYILLFLLLFYFHPCIQVVIMVLRHLLDLIIKVVEYLVVPVTFFLRKLAALGRFNSRITIQILP